MRPARSECAKQIPGWCYWGVLCILGILFEIACASSNNILRGHENEAMRSRVPELPDREAAGDPSVAAAAVAAALVQSQEVYNLLDRIMPELSSQFDVEIDTNKVNADAGVEEGKDRVKLVKTEGKARVVVQASSGVAATWGIHHYLKYYVGSHFSWDTTRSCRYRPTSSVVHT